MAEAATEKSATERKCTVEGCKRPYRAKNYCISHYQKWRRGEVEGHRARYKICSKEACRKQAGKWGLCDEHRKSGAPEAAAAAPAAG